jgi:hypothetical protein
MKVCHPNLPSATMLNPPRATMRGIGFRDGRLIFEFTSRIKSGRRAFPYEYENTPVMVGVFSVAVDIVERSVTFVFGDVFVFVTFAIHKDTGIHKKAQEVLPK